MLRKKIEHRSHFKFLGKLPNTCDQKFSSVVRFVYLGHKRFCEHREDIEVDRNLCSSKIDNNTSTINDIVWKDRRLSTPMIAEKVNG